MVECSWLAKTRFIINLLRNKIYIGNFVVRSRLCYLRTSVRCCARLRFSQNFLYINLITQEVYFLLPIAYLMSNFLKGETFSAALKPNCLTVWSILELFENRVFNVSVISSIALLSFLRIF